MNFLGKSAIITRINIIFMSFDTTLILNKRANYRGLTTAQASEAQKQYGLNERPAKKRTGWLKRLWHIFSEPMMMLILATAVVYFFLGDKLESLIFLLSIIPIGLMEFFQQKRTDEAISALDKMMVEYCHVFRDDKIIKLEAKYLVPGDYVYLTAGDKIPADGIILDSPGFQVDESMLTGESVPVIKSQLKGEIKSENRLSQSTMVAQGEGYMLVDATGANTAYGKLGALLAKIADTETPLQKKIDHLVRAVAMVGLGTALFVAIFLIFKHGWVEGILGGLTIAMSLIPEEFPVVFSVFLVLGVWRMARQKALVRKMEMVETLGSATVICTDKTGTLTEGRMSLQKIYYQGKLLDAHTTSPSEWGDLIHASLLALERVATDPIEIELQRTAEKFGYDLKQFFADHTLRRDSTFSSETKMVHHIWQEKDGQCAQYSVGAPESILKACALADDERIKLARENEKLASQGLRVIGVGQKDCGVDDEVVLRDLNFVGFLVMSDPARAGVKEAIGICQKAGIRVMMITGDNKLTAHSIAEDIAMSHNEELIGGEEIEKMSDEELSLIVKNHNIFARVHPEHKYRIVEALQKNGEIVAMTGDGVNDAPALKKADIGIAMGDRGTEVARAAAGIVLLDDNFSSIVSAVREGRHIYDNLRKAFVFLFSFHLPIIGLSLVPVLMGEPLVFMPIHIIFLELICDPTAVLGFERERARRGLMDEPPRDPRESIINKKMVGVVLVQGLSITAVSFAFYFYYGILHGNLEFGRTAAFASLIVSQVMLILLTREWSQVKSNKLLLSVSGLTFVGLIAILFFAPIRSLFHLIILSPTAYALVLFLPFFAMATVSLFLGKKK